MNLVTLLTVIFVIAKITGAIDWSWFWVFSPVIASVSFIGLFFVIAVIAAAVSD